MYVLPGLKWLARIRDFASARTRAQVLFGVYRRKEKKKQGLEEDDDIYDGIPDSPLIEQKSRNFSYHPRFIIISNIIFVIL